MKGHYYLGCPVWACERWKGRLYTAQAPRDQWLTQYAQVFGTVEGNSVFYHLPTLETVLRWLHRVPAGFRFALKFPRVITHEKRLLNAQAETRAFLDLLEPLSVNERLGTCWLQLPPGFAPHHLADLQAYLDQLPSHLSFAVELRHPEFFRSPQTVQQLNEFLEARAINRVILDSRPLFSAAPDDSAEVASQRRKPRLPVCYDVTGKHPIVRLIGRNDLPQNLPWVREWAPRIARWIEAGLTPFVFTHTPDERHAPDFARMFHEELRCHTNVLDEMPPWPGEREDDSPQQLELF
jgi:uncharacterized protein YecE (DUF72 family)